MRAIAVSMLTLLTGACTMDEPADARPPVEAAAQPRAEQAAAESCTLLVRFGSYASGIDAEAAEAVAAALRADRRAGAVTERAWGREGERDLCANPAAEDGRALVKAARDALPDRKLNGYVDILLDGTRVFTTQTSG